MLVRADVRCARTASRRVAALVGEQLFGVGPGADGRAARLQGDGLGRAAVTRKSGVGQKRVRPREVVGAGPCDRSGSRSGLEQGIVGDDLAGVVDRTIAGEQGAHGGDCSRDLHHAASGARACLGIQGHGAVEKVDAAASDIAAAAIGVTGLAGRPGRAVAQAQAATLSTCASSAAGPTLDRIRGDGVIDERQRSHDDIDCPAPALATVSATAAGAAAGSARTGESRGRVRQGHREASLPALVRGTPAVWALAVSSRSDDTRAGAGSASS